MRVARVAAQAKVNLFLRVGPRDATGYHSILTLFHRIDLADDVVVRAGGSVRALDCAGPQVPAGGLGASEKNLVFRAALAYAEHTGWPRGFSIELTKNIPVGGGLGGGSADAGAVLRALDALALTPVGAEPLLEIGASLGSDVPFLSSELVNALGAGRGELVDEQAAMPARTVVVVVPPFSIATADAYRWLDTVRADTAVDQPKLPHLIPAGLFSDWDWLATSPHFSGNDFEPVVEERHPDLLNYRERLTALGARLARLAGSGSCVFGIFDGTAPSAADLAIDAEVIETRTSARVVQVEVLE